MLHECGRGGRAKPQGGQLTDEGVRRGRAEHVDVSGARRGASARGARPELNVQQRHGRAGTAQHEVFHAAQVEERERAARRAEN